ncbi:polysaccharide deacetylase family protein [Helcococcus kunzii]|uniref:polysaccharide deacetylase family protein n=1 Tax=Helcococcus kunzii TaxID=40091 RepID=UPI0024AD6D18|nr:polysaccharide deacetylase family protein [Helcococcus kunzii]
MKKVKIISIITLFLILLNACSPKNENEETNENVILEDTIKELQTIKETEKESKEDSIKEIETETESEKEIINEDIRLGKKISVNKDFNVYGTASDAKNKIKPTQFYKKGEYYIFKIVKDAINLSRDTKVPGGWANYEDLNIDINSIPKEDFADNKSANKETDNETNNEANDNKEKNVSTSKNDIIRALEKSNLSTKPNEWSYAYPANLDLLQKYNGYNKIEGSGKTLYLTFDNGYEYKNNTSRILDILSKNGIKATFFATGTFIKENPNVANRIANEGHNLANHTEKHINQAKSAASDVYDDITTWETTAKKIIKSNKFAKLMRPPEGAYSETSLFLANKLGYKTIFWNFAYGDWDTSHQPDPSSSLKKLLKHNEDGSIILLHAISDTNVEILEKYIKESQKQGYTFKLL